MNERHLEHDENTKAAIAELTEAVHNLTNEQELRLTALKLATEYCIADKENEPCAIEAHMDTILDLARGFYYFLSGDGKAD